MDTQLELDRQALALFRRLLEIDTHDRAALDVEIASLEPALAERVRQLMQLHRKETGRFERHREQLQGHAELPARLGAFTLVRELGRGGMGIVAEGQREAEGFTQRVAIKWIPAWQVDAARRQRFLFERDVVSRLRHPHIAQLVDGGEGEHGELWYAMELVEGQDLLQHCRERALDLRARVRLLLDLCSAVAYAHRNLILHRDIKPSNVLVDREGQLKLIDFGIAKGLDDAAEGLTQDAVPLTPRYAAPEQLRGERLSTTSDVWQVGAVAFELLSGQPARKDSNIHRSSSAAIEGSKDGFECAVEAASLSKALHGDLDAILKKALRDSPEERYASIEELASDLEAHLLGEPVKVRKGEQWYSMLSFLRRNRMPVGLGSVALLLAGCLAWLAVWSIQAERDAAERSLHLLSQIFTSLPVIDEGGDANALTVASFLERVNAKIVENDGIDPKHRQRFAWELARRALDLGAFRAAMDAAETNIRLVEALHGAESLTMAESLDLLAEITSGAGGDSDAAIAHLDRAAVLHARLGSTVSFSHLDHLITRAWVLTGVGRSEEAVESMRRATEIARILPGAAPGFYETRLAGYSHVLRSNNLWSDARAAVDQALSGIDQLGGAVAAVDIAFVQGEACIVHSNLGSANAVPLCLRRVESLERADALQSDGGVTALLGLAIAQMNSNALADALRTIERAEAAAIAHEGRNELSRNMPHVQLTRARILSGLSRWDESASAFRESIRLFVAISGDDSGRVGRVRVALIETLIRAGRSDEARSVFQQQIRIPETDSDYLQRRQAAWDALYPAPEAASSSDVRGSR